MAPTPNYRLRIVLEADGVEQDVAGDPAYAVTADQLEVNTSDIEAAMRIAGHLSEALVEARAFERAAFDDKVRDLQAEGFTREDAVTMATDDGWMAPR